MAQRHSSTATQRAQWVAELLIHQGEYGVVTRLSEAIAVSRQTLYAWRARGQAALEGAFRPDLAITLMTPELRRAILTLWVVGHASERDIQACLVELEGRAVSLGTISHVLAEAQQRALEWFAQHAPADERVIELDELYGHDRYGAYLSIVDAHSYAVWATSGPLAVDDESWILLGWAARDAGLRWKSLVSDGGCAIRDAAKTLAPDRLVQRDVWHVLHRCAVAQKRLEGRLNDLQAQAARTARYAERVAAGEHPSGGKPQYDVPTQTERVGSAQRVVNALRWLGHELKRLLEVVVMDRRGVLDSAARRAELLTWLDLLEEMRSLAPEAMQAELKAVHTQVRLALEGLLVFAVGLDAVQHAVAAELGAAALAVLGWAWLRRAILAPQPDELVAGVAQGWRAPAQRMIRAWQASVRTSSAVENWHSILRPHLAVHRRLSPGLLALLAVWHNHRIFTRGRHRGSSPLHLSGLRDAPTDWLAALGYPPPATAAIKRLPSSQPALAVAA